MRSWTLLAATALFVIASEGAAAAQASGELASAAPVVLFGDGDVVAPTTFVLHHAFRDGSLDGSAYSGRLIEREVVHVPPQQSHECDKLDGKVREQTLLTANSSKVWETIEYRLLDGAFARLIYLERVQFLIGQAGQSQDASVPFAYLGPNPYARQTEQTGPEDSATDLDAPAFPTWPFAVAPNARFVTGRPLTLELHWGTIETTQNERVRSFEAGWAEETEQVDAEGPLGATGSKVTCYLQLSRTYLFDQEFAIVGIDQDGVARALDAWAGAAPSTAFGEDDAVPPPGSWERSRGADIDAALEAFHLPATMVGAPDFHIALEGSARFDDALGAVTVGDRVHEADHDIVTIGGYTNLEPTGNEDGRRMTTRIGDDVAFFHTLDQEDGGLAAYTPYVAGAAGGLVAFGAAFYAWPTLKLRGTQLLLLPLYARLKKEDLLENPLRDDILETVHASPGISASELGRRLSCGWGTLVYHLTVLERMQLLSSQREGRHKRFFVQGQINYSDKTAVGLLANPSARTILDAIQQRPGLIQRDLGHMLGLSAGTVAWHVERLEEAGLILKEAEGRVVRYYPSSRLMELTKQLAA